MRISDWSSDVCSSDLGGTRTMDQPLILVDPLPRTLDLICDGETRSRLEALGRLVVHEAGPMPAETVDRLLPETVLLIGQTPMPKERLVRAPRLRAIFNVETNFLTNVDYAHCRSAEHTYELPSLMRI